MTTADIFRYVRTCTGHSLNRDEGILHAATEGDVDTVTVCWMATPAALRYAADQRSQLVICHEALFYPYPLGGKEPPAHWQRWRVNDVRIQALEGHGMCCARIHGSADEICIFDEFARILGLGKPSYADGLVKVYEIPPIRFSHLVEKVKNATGMDALRVASNPEDDPEVHRVGLPWGGLGLFVNVAYQQKLVDLNCDVFIAGESDNYGMRFALESGIPMIETSHEVSEHPGLRVFCDMLQRQFQEARFLFYENRVCWQVR